MVHLVGEMYLHPNGKRKYTIWTQQKDEIFCVCVCFSATPSDAQG